MFSVTKTNYTVLMFVARCFEWVQYVDVFRDLQMFDDPVQQMVIVAFVDFLAIF